MSEASVDPDDIKYHPGSLGPFKLDDEAPDFHVYSPTGDTFIPLTKRDPKYRPLSR